MLRKQKMARSPTPTVQNFFGLNEKKKKAQGHQKIKCQQEKKVPQKVCVCVCKREREKLEVCRLYKIITIKKGSIFQGYNKNASSI